MILWRVADCLRRRGQATPAEIARHLGAETSAVREMLEFWRRRGRVERARVVPPACGRGCAACPSVPRGDLYRWRAPGKP